MSKLVRGNQIHMSRNDRIYIQQALEKGLIFKDIAKFICKDPTTISKEVKNTGCTSREIPLLLPTAVAKTG